MKVAEVFGLHGVNGLIETMKRHWLVVIGLIALSTFMGITWAAKPIVIQADGQNINLRTYKSTVGEAVAQAQITIGPQDVVTPAMSTKLNRGMEIKVLRSFPVTVLVDGQETEVVTPAVPVQEVIELAGIELDPLDRVQPALTEKVQPGVPVEVIRVEEKLEEVETEIPYSVDRRSDQSLERGINRTVQKGKNGLERQVFKVTLENGQEVKREQISSETVQPPVTAIVAMGALTTVSRGGKRVEFEQAIPMVATAYTYTGSKTATGVSPYVGGIAVDPTVIPLGARVYVDGYGYAKAVDRGGAIKGNKIDLFFESEKECHRWGRRSVKVYVLK